VPCHIFNLLVYLLEVLERFIIVPDRLIQVPGRVIQQAVSREQSGGTSD
jgi:hypothetical protein